VSAMSRSSLSWTPESDAFALNGEPLPRLLERLTRVSAARSGTQPASGRRLPRAACARR
jgi:hypothetical protein